MKSFDLSRHVNPAVGCMEAYTPGAQVQESGWIKLNTNESPFPPPAGIWAAVEGERERMALYPDPRANRLREAIGRRWGVSAGQVLASNGSDDVLNLLVRTFGGKGLRVGAMDPSYSLYPVLVRGIGQEIERIPFESAFELPVEQILQSKCNLFFLTCPHAPSGVGFAANDVERLARELDGILVIDEAYADFADHHYMKLAAERPNVVVTRTFSKAFGMAGFRLGYAVASAAIIGYLDRIRDSYNLDRLAQAAGVAAMADLDYFAANIKRLCNIRDEYHLRFEALGWHVFRSQANFLFLRPALADGKTGADVADSLFSHLKAKRILVRYFPSHSLTCDYLRISLGNESQMQVLWDCVESWQRSA